jgi:hypothetical protein
MPKGPKGEKRPADVIGNAVKVMRIATGEETEALPDPSKDYARKVVEVGRTGVGSVDVLVANAQGGRGRPMDSRRSFL